MTKLSKYHLVGEMDTSAEMWALVGKIIALVAIPHAAAQGLSKLVAISSRPSFAVAAKTMEAVTYATLALTSTIVVHTYLVAAPPNLSSADIEAARNTITLAMAIEIYAVVYFCVLAGLGTVLKAVNTALYSTDSRAFNRWLIAAFVVLLFAWNAALSTIGRAIDQHPADGPVLAALVVLGAPLLGVLAIWFIRRWHQPQIPPAPAADATD